MAEKIAVIKGETGPKVGFVTASTIPDQKFPVKIKEYSTEADSVTQTYRVTLVMPQDPNHKFYPGMSVTFFPDEGKADKLQQGKYLLPISAVTADEKDQHHVWVVDENTMQVQIMPVTVGQMVGDKIEVLSGLQPGMRIVSAGVSYLRPNMKINLFDEKVGY